MTAALQVGSLFTGYGGLDTAVRQVLGGDLAWVSDNHPSAVKLLAHHHPDVPNLGDITAIDWATVPPVDVLAGGFPCTDVSLAGRGAGLKPGTRSGLWSHMATAISVLRPRMVVIENVRGLCSAPAHSDLEPCPWCVGDDEGVPLRAFGAVLGDLADLGYDADWCGLRAADVGAPHGRFRVFIVAVPSVARGVAPNPAGDGRDEGWAEPARFVGRPDAAVGGHLAGHAAVLGRDAAPAPDRGGEPAGTLGGPGVAAADLGRDARQEDHARRRSGTTADPHSGGLGADQRDVRARQPDPDRGAVAHTDGGGVREQPVAEPGRGGVPVAVIDGAHRTAADTTRLGHRDAGTPGVGGVPAPAVTGGQRDAVADSDGARQQQREGDEPDLAGRADDGAESHLDWAQFTPAVRRWETILGRPAPAPTEPGKRGKPVLSPRFVEWLMGVNDGWVTGVPDLSRTDMLRLLGNGVVPQQGAAALRYLLASHLAAVAA